MAVNYCGWLHTAVERWQVRVSIAVERWQVMAVNYCGWLHTAVERWQVSCLYGCELLRWLHTAVERWQVRVSIAVERWHWVTTTMKCSNKGFIANHQKCLTNIKCLSSL